MRILLALAGVAACVSTGGQASADPSPPAPRYRLVLLPPAGPGANQPLSINNAHVVVGVAGQQFSGNAALWAGGTAVDLGTGDGSVFEQSSANKITDSGLIVGSTGFATNQLQHAAFYQAGRWIDAGTGFDGPTAFATFRSVNSSMVAVGQRSPFVPDLQHFKDLRTEAFAWKAGVFTTISLGGKNGQAFDVNANGVVVGQSEAANRTPHAFAWQNGKAADLGRATGIQADLQSVAFAVNRSGQSVGYAVFNPFDGYEAALWIGNRAYDLGHIGGVSGSEALGLNDRGVVVGRSSVDFESDHAFVWKAGRMYDLNDLLVNKPARNVVLESANAIAADGTITGNTCTVSCRPGAPISRAFLLTPVN